MAQTIGWLVVCLRTFDVLQMIKSFILLLLVIGICPVQANNLIFKSGFENTALVSGTATGLNSTGLSLQLTVNTTTEILNVDQDGVFVFHTNVNIGNHWSVAILTLPDNPQQQNCEINNNSGSMPSGGADVLIVTCTSIPWNWDQMNWDEGGWN